MNCERRKARGRAYTTPRTHLAAKTLLLGLLLAEGAAAVPTSLTWSLKSRHIHVRALRRWEW